jgi:hypothetical protein
MSFEMSSIRQRITKMLSEIEEPLTAEDIARMFEIDVNEVYEHLEHIARVLEGCTVVKRRW